MSIEIGGAALYGAAMALKRRNLIYLAVADALLFLLANVTSKSHGHPGTASDVFWYVFLIGVLLLVVLGLVAVIQSFRTRTA
jgi:choline-glycine betaine transporter